MSNKINFKKDKIPFTQVANDILCDKNLSAKAKGLYAYLYSKPEGWDFAIDRIKQDFKDSRFAINSGLQELEKEGYLIRERQKTGRVFYLLKSQMIKINMGVKKPHANNCKVQKLQSAKTSTVSNKDKEVIKSKRNKEISDSGESQDSGVKFNPLGAEVIKHFSDFVDPKNKKHYNNTTQREACDFLIEEYGLDLVLKVIQIIPKTNKMPRYEFPHISTAHQLKENWKKLEDGLIIKKNGGKKEKPKVIISSK